MTEDSSRQCISEVLAGIRRPWQVGFEYLPEGVLCQGRWYPIVKMEWIEAVGDGGFKLKDYVSQTDSKQKEW